MDIGVEISLYPLTAEFAPVIHGFIDRLHADGRLKVVSNSMSTQVFGHYDDVFEVLRRELRVTFDSGKAVFAMKVIGPLATGASRP
jgi:uncharacterized protein YqgV (UPF0045/DUF77 family)